jgi:hypothetical protein
MKLKTTNTIALILAASQALAADQPAQAAPEQAAKPAQAASSPKDSNGKPRMKTVEEVWGKSSKYGNGFPRLGGLEK